MSAPDPGPKPPTPPILPYAQRRARPSPGYFMAWAAAGSVLLSITLLLVWLKMYLGAPAHWSGEWRDSLAVAAFLLTVAGLLVSLPAILFRRADEARSVVIPLLIMLGGMLVVLILGAIVAFFDQARW